MNKMVLVIRSPEVVSEIIDDELIIMNLKTGNYYSSTAVGAAVWSLIEAGLNNDQIVDTVSNDYSVKKAAAEKHLFGFFEKLLNEGLVQAKEVDDASVTTFPEVGSASPKKPEFTPPTLNIYTDMQDLMLLDPIHDVGEVGWPQPKDDSGH